MVNASSPTLRRRQLGIRLRELRLRAGMSAEDVAERLLCSTAKISRIETGGRTVSQRDVRDLCEIYGVANPAEREHLMNLARESKEPAWWQDYDFPTMATTYLGLEAAASAISDYSLGFVPGLLQIEDYARALIEGMRPTIAADQVEQRVAARLNREKLLTQDQPPRFCAVVDEAALHRVVGGPSVMRAQLVAVCERANLANVTVQVIPFTAGAHPGQDSPFTLLAFEEALHEIVYVEGLIGFVYLERREDVDRYKMSFDQLRALALGPRDSMRLIERTAAAYS